MLLHLLSILSSSVLAHPERAAALASHPEEQQAREDVGHAYADVERMSPPGMHLAPGYTGVTAI